MRIPVWRSGASAVGRRSALAVIVAVALAVGTAAAAIAAHSTLARSGTSVPIVKVRTTSLGRILVDGKGRSLYLFAVDRAGKSKCTGACAATWPPFLSAKMPKAIAGARQSLVGLTRRSDGHLQVTYHGHPLYWYKFDGSAGSTKGEGIDQFGGEWFLVSPAGSSVKSKESGTTTTTTTTTTSSGGGGWG